MTNPSGLRISDPIVLPYGPDYPYVTMTCWQWQYSTQPLSKETIQFRRVLSRRRFLSKSMKGYKPR